MEMVAYLPGHLFQDCKLTLVRDAPLQAEDGRAVNEEKVFAFAGRTVRTKQGAAIRVTVLGVIANEIL